MKVRIASAGTGKTTSLVLRYLEHLATLPPHRIGVVTYTRLATAELRERIRHALLEIAAGNDYLDFEPTDHLRKFARKYAQQVLEAPIRTIHGFFADILRLAAPHLSIDPDFSVLDAGAAMALFHEAAQSVAYLQELEDPPIDKAEYLFGKRPQAEELTPTGTASKELHDFYAAALEEYLRRTGGRQLGPADIELMALRLTQLPKDFLRRIAARYPVLLVDEYQDTSPMQSEVFRTLERIGVQIEIVGDPKQSIYGFRDADPEGFRRAAREGELLEPLTTTRRHAVSLTGFLNTFTGTLSKEQQPPFTPEEAPAVTTARTDAPGSTTLLICRGANYEKLNELRNREADLLASHLKELVAEHGYSWSDVFVLTRSHSPAAQLARAFESWGIPYVLIGSRGLYALPEIRDLYHALAAALAPRKMRDSLAAFLLGPFCMLTTLEVDQIFAGDDPVAALESIKPEIAARLKTIRDWTTTLSPEESLIRLTREKILEGGVSYYDTLNKSQREHVDYVIARLRMAQTYQQVLYLLETLKAYDTEEGSFPTTTSDAVEIMTVHGAKGREAPVVAVFNTGSPFQHRAQPVYVEPFTGRYAIKGDDEFDQLKQKQAVRERLEEDRLLYVALSRARDHLIVSGSLSWPEGKNPYRWQGSWAHTLMQRVGQDVFDKVVIKTPAEIPARPAKARLDDGNSTGVAVDEALLEPVPLGPWPVYSPSALKAERYDPASEEEAVPRDPEASLFARIAGILTHEGIARSWHPDRDDLTEILQGEEVTHELPPERHQELKEQVEKHLRSYWALVANGDIIHPNNRNEDYVEYPIAYPLNGTVWEGVIDRVYRVGETWILEDYKTDSEVHPERYYSQLALYAKALNDSWGIEPVTRLVFLRKQTIVELGSEELRLGEEKLLSTTQ